MATEVEKCSHGIKSNSKMIPMYNILRRVRILSKYRGDSVEFAQLQESHSSHDQQDLE